LLRLSRSELDQLTRQLTERENAVRADHQELATLREDNSRLARQVAMLEQQLQVGG
jgi:hypothetical protein